MLGKDTLHCFLGCGENLNYELSLLWYERGVTVGN